MITVTPPNDGGRRSRSSVASPKRSDAGTTLIEVLISMSLLGMVGLTVLGAAATSASAASDHRSLAEAQALLASTGDVLMNVSDPDSVEQATGDAVVSYISCVDEPDNDALIDDYQEQVDHIVATFSTNQQVDVTSVQYWDSTAFAFGDDCHYNDGDRLQEIQLDVTDTEARTHSLKVLRRPFLLTPSTVPGSSIGTDTDGDGEPDLFAIEPTPGLDGPSSSGTGSTSSGTGSTTTDTSTGSTSTSTGTSSTSAVSCVVSMSQWDYNVQLDVAVTNNSSTRTDSWKLFVPLPTGAVVQSNWNSSVVAVSGGIEVSNVGYNGKINSGQSKTLGIQFSHPNQSVGAFAFDCVGQ